FSRQIGIDPNTGQVVPVNAGGKLTGTLGNYQIGVMDVQTRSDGPNPAVNYAVVRAKRSLFGNSYVGVMGIDKESGSALDPFNRTGGVDSAWSSGRTSSSMATPPVPTRQAPIQVTQMSAPMSVTRRTGCSSLPGGARSA